MAPVDLVAQGQGRNAFSVESEIGRPPSVAGPLSRQRWALSRHPFGVKPGREPGGFFMVVHLKRERLLLTQVARVQTAMLVSG
jgi:hypothetical protein